MAGLRVVGAFQEDERAGFADQRVLVYVFVAVAEGEVEGFSKKARFLKVLIKVWVSGIGVHSLLCCVSCVLVTDWVVLGVGGI